MSGRCRGSRATAACSIISGPQFLGCNLFAEAKKNSDPWTLEVSVDKVYMPGCEWDRLWAPLGKVPGYSDYLIKAPPTWLPRRRHPLLLSPVLKVQGISSCTNETFLSLVQTWNASPTWVSSACGLNKTWRVSVSTVNAKSIMHKSSNYSSWLELSGPVSVMPRISHFLVCLV